VKRLCGSHLKSVREGVGALESQDLSVASKRQILRAHASHEEQKLVADGILRATTRAIRDARWQAVISLGRDELERAPVRTSKDLHRNIA